MPPQPISLMLVDDHSVVRMGLAAVLAYYPDVQVVAQAEDGHEAVARFRELRPDVVLMDARMPGLGGVDAMRAIRAEWPQARVIMLTTSDLDDDVQQALEAGADGYLLKSVGRDELLDAIRHVHAGQSYIPAAIQKLMAELSHRKHLSGREFEVLDGMRRGLSNRDIALGLAISEHTVKAHVKAILHKLESADRAEAVARAFEQGLLRVSDR